jgi:ABC-type branched-subunit amino acid transport system permease subunit
MWQNIYVQIYAILGGVSFAFLGPVVGAVVMTFFPEYIRMTSVVAPVFTGILLILLILFLPGGLLGLGKYWPIFAKVVSKEFSLLVRKARQS